MGDEWDGIVIFILRFIATVCLSSISLCLFVLIATCFSSGLEVEKCYKSHLSPMQIFAVLLIISFFTAIGLLVFGMAISAILDAVGIEGIVTYFLSGVIAAALYTLPLLYIEYEKGKYVIGIILAVYGGVTALYWWWLKLIGKRWRARDL